MNRRQLQRRRTKAMIYSFNHSKRYRYYWWPKLLREMLQPYQQRIINDIFRESPLMAALRKSPSKGDGVTQ